MEKGFRARLRSRRAKQAAAALTGALAGLLLVGLCTNTVVLPFVDLSGALVRKDALVPETMVRPAASDRVPKLSFLDVLSLGERAPAEAVLSKEIYTNETYLEKVTPSEDLLPQSATVAGELALQARMGFFIRRYADGRRTLLSAEGEVILEEMPAGMELTGKWDKEERAVFSRGGEWVVWDGDAFVKTDFEPKLYAVDGVDLPVYYNRPTGTIELSYKDGKYGYYVIETGEARYQHTYSGTSYQFIGGYGALGAPEGIIVVDGIAKRYFTSWGTLLQPEGEGVETLGYYRMDHGLFLVVRRDEAGKKETLVLTEDNQIFHLPRDFELVCYTDGVFLLKKGDKYGFLDYTGRWIADPVYTAAEPFCEGLAVVTDASGKSGVIDTAGNVVIACEFERIEGASGGVLALYRDGEWTLLVKKAVPVAPEEEPKGEEA